MKRAEMIKAINTVYEKWLTDGSNEQTLGESIADELLQESKVTDEMIEKWAIKKSNKHFEKYWIKENGSEYSNDEKTAELLTNYLIELTTFQNGLCTGAKALRDNKIK